EWRAYELIFFVLLGVLGVRTSVLLEDGSLNEVSLNYRWSRDVRGGTRLKVHPVAEVILASIAFKKTQVSGWDFIPALGVGACAGRIVGIAVQWLQYHYPNSAVFDVCEGDVDCVVPGLSAMMKDAAALSGVTRTTASLAVMMFELTGTLTYAVPVMLSVLVAKTLLMLFTGYLSANTC
ncbi:chloride channel, partial [Suillus subalutaceus]|uniref:chloride channel n=1 Tax=Suillus subalutaceus TaxID=48586 RepID=UPI001B867CBC